MFSVFCPAAGAHVLVGPSHIQALFGRDGEFVIVYRCSCGDLGEWTASGRRSRESRSSRPWPEAAFE